MLRHVNSPVEWQIIWLISPPRGWRLTGVFVPCWGVRRECAGQNGN